MSLVAKFIGGKQVSRSKNGSYTFRAQCAGLDFQLGPSGHYSSIKRVIGKMWESVVGYEVRQYIPFGTVLHKRYIKK